jgi:hypothetical protein
MASLLRSANREPNKESYECSRKACQLSYLARDRLPVAGRKLTFE